MLCQEQNLEKRLLKQLVSQYHGHRPQEPYDVSNDKAIRYSVRTSCSSNIIEILTRKAALYGSPIGRLAKIAARRLAAEDLKAKL